MFARIRVCDFYIFVSACVLICVYGCAFVLALVFVCGCMSVGAVVLLCVRLVVNVFVC